MKDIVVLRFYISSIKIWIIYHSIQLVCQHVQTWQYNATLMRTCETHWYFCTELFRALRGPTHYISIITNITRTWTTQIWYGLLYHLRWTVRCCHFLLVDSLGTPSIACLSLIYLVKPYVKTQCFQVTKYMYHNMPNFWGPDTQAYPYWHIMWNIFQGYCEPSFAHIL